MMACAFDGPMPLSVCNDDESAVLIFIKSAACTVKAAGAAHIIMTAINLMSCIRLACPVARRSLCCGVYLQHVAQDFCKRRGVGDRLWRVRNMRERLL